MKIQEIIDTYVQTTTEKETDRAVKAYGKLTKFNFVPYARFGYVSFSSRGNTERNHISVYSFPVVQKKQITLAELEALAGKKARKKKVAVADVSAILVDVAVQVKDNMEFDEIIMAAQAVGYELCGGVANYKARTDLNGRFGVVFFGSGVDGWISATPRVVATAESVLGVLRGTRKTVENAKHFASLDVGGGYNGSFFDGNIAIGCQFINRENALKLYNALKTAYEFVEKRVESVGKLANDISGIAVVSRYAKPSVSIANGERDRLNENDTLAIYLQLKKMFD
jgi:hypothetical protein